VWALIASMFVGNIILVIMNLPMVPLFAMSLRFPYHYLYPPILMICIVGAFSVNNSVYDIWVMWIFGIFGYFMKKYDIPAAPLVIALVLGPMLEYNLYRALALSLGDISTFFTRPISATLMAITGLMIIAMFFKAVRSKRSMLEEEEN